MNSRKLIVLKTNIGVYILWSKNEVVYIGKSINLKTRIFESIERRDGHKKIDSFSIIEVESEEEAFYIEKLLIYKHRPCYNKRLFYGLSAEMDKNIPNVYKLEKIKKDMEFDFDFKFNKPKINQDFPKNQYNKISYVIYSFAIRELKLKGTDLLVFSFIYDITKDGSTWYSGGVNLIEKEVNAKRKSVICSINRLEKTGLIEKVKSNRKTGHSHKTIMKLRAIHNSINLKNNSNFSRVTRKYTKR